MTIQWVTTQEELSDHVQFVKEGESSWYEVAGYHQSLFTNKPYTLHTVELRNLEADSRYHFHINNEGKTYQFKTLPKDLKVPLKFIEGGDMYHGEKDVLEKVNYLAASKSPAFVLIGGDIAYSCTKNDYEKNERWLTWLQVWSNTMISPDGDLIPIIPAIGNHEVKGGNFQTPRQAKVFYTLFPMPGYTGSNVLDFGDYMSLILLDSGHTHPVAGAQTKFLESTLEVRGQVPYKFAVYHVPAYPSHGRFEKNISKQIRQNWVPLFEKHHLNVAFEHNDHAYKRSHPILQNKVNAKGVLYVGDGAWGVKNTRTIKTPKEAWYIAKSASTRHFIEVILKEKEAEVKVFTPENQLLDSFTITP